MNEQQIRKLLYPAIQGYNRHLHKEHLDTLSISELLPNCHPIDRGDFKRQFDRDGINY
jgi:hypothetical protein